MLSPVHEFGDIWVKREDIACFSDRDSPSGSKVRQYTAMVQKSRDIRTGQPAPCIVGCSSFSAMQIYVASAAYKHGAQGIIYVSARKEMTDATEYCVRLGCEVIQVKPGYMTVVRKRARDRAKALGRVVQWDVRRALNDTLEQCANLPADIRRVVIPTGSGLTASGCLAGLAIMGHKASVLAVAVSGLADEDEIQQNALRAINSKIGVDQLSYDDLPEFELLNLPFKYGDYFIHRLQDGTPLDPFYSAKAWPSVVPGDCFWPVGLRPVSSMPHDCELAFADWRGP